MTVASTEETRTITEIERTGSGKEILAHVSDHNPFGVPKASGRQQMSIQVQRRRIFTIASGALIWAATAALLEVWVAFWPSGSGERQG
jgi:hypothetical protein